MHYKFVDIGCSNSAVSVDEYGLACNGLLIEPIKEMCDILPQSKTVKRFVLPLVQKMALKRLR